MKKFEFDGREYNLKTVSFKLIKVGDVVLEGLANYEYRMITDIDYNSGYIEYFNPITGYYSSTNIRYCHYLVTGQKNANGELFKILYE